MKAKKDPMPRKILSCKESARLRKSRKKKRTTTTGSSSKGRCKYRQEACVWHRRCHCLYRVGDKGSENMPFCIDKIKTGKCPEGKDKNAKLR